MTELKPCPFCGGKAQFDLEGKKWGVWCIDCRAEFSHPYARKNSKKEAIKMWNHRTEQKPEAEPPKGGEA